MAAALMAAISVTNILATLQLALVAAQAFSASHVARTTARFVTLQVNATDADVVAQASSIATNLPGMTDGGMSSVTITPSCAALVSGRCPGREAGAAVTVTVNADLTAVMFLPTAYGVAPVVLSLPISTQPISHTMFLE